MKKLLFTFISLFILSCSSPISEQSKIYEQNKKQIESLITSYPCFNEYLENSYKQAEKIMQDTARLKIEKNILDVYFTANELIQNSTLTELNLITERVKQLKRHIRKIEIVKTNDIQKKYLDRLSGLSNEKINFYNSWFSGKKFKSKETENIINSTYQGLNELIKDFDQFYDELGKSSFTQKDKTL